MRDSTVRSSSAVGPVSQQAIFEAGAIVGYYIKGLIRKEDCKAQRDWRLQRFRRDRPGM